MRTDSAVQAACTPASMNALGATVPSASSEKRSGRDPRRKTILLVYPPFDDKRDRSAYYVAPPLGLLMIAPFLERQHDVAILDFILDIKAGRLRQGAHIYRRCAEDILQRSPDVVALSTQCTTNPGAINIARLIKASDPKIKVIFGGHDVSFLAADYLNSFPEIDFVVSGEAELTFPRLIDAIVEERAPEGIPGVAYRGPTGEPVACPGHERVRDLDSLPRPAYHLVRPMEEYFSHSRVPTILIDSGRGCAFSCEFCQTTLLTGHKIRYRSVDSIVAELKDYYAAYGRFEAYFVHDLFTARRSFVEDLCHRLIDEQLDISWQCRCRLDQVDKPLLELMAAAGCRMLLYGVESGSPETLERMEKRLRNDAGARTLDIVRTTVEAGIFPSLSMVIGLPEESFADLDATMALAHRFTQIGNVNAFIQLMSPLPGTALASRLASRFNYRGVVAPTAFSQGIEFDHGNRTAEDEELIAAHPGIFQSFQVVVPDHGDLDICVDVTIAYCKLLEVYGRTFGALLRVLDQSHLRLFRSWRDVVLHKTGWDNLAKIKDSEIWRHFEDFVGERCSPSLDASVWEAFRLERFIHRATISDPIVGPSDLADARYVRLHPRAEIFSARRSDVDLEQAAGEAELLFMGPDRLHSIRISPALEAVLRASQDPELPESIHARISDTLRSIGTTLAEKGLLVPAARATLGLAEPQLAD